MRFPLFRFLLLASLVILLVAGVTQEVIRLSHEHLPANKTEWAALAFAAAVLAVGTWSHGGHIWHALKELWKKPMLVAALFTAYGICVVGVLWFISSHDPETSVVILAIMSFVFIVSSIGKFNELQLFLTDPDAWVSMDNERQRSTAAARRTIAEHPEWRFKGLH